MIRIVQYPMWKTPTYTLVYTYESLDRFLDHHPASILTHRLLTHFAAQDALLHITACEFVVMEEHHLVGYESVETVQLPDKWYAPTRRTVYDVVEVISRYHECTQRRVMATYDTKAEASEVASTLEVLTAHLVTSEVYSWYYEAVSRYVYDLS
jgi:hypothetical protein